MSIYVVGINDNKSKPIEIIGPCESMKQAHDICNLWEERNNSLNYHVINSEFPHIRYLGPSNYLK